jgi:hypothetical protein
VWLRHSDDDGAAWSDPPVRVNDDATARSQFLPRVAVDQTTGVVAVSWHDARDDGGAGAGDRDGVYRHTVWAAVSVDGGASFLANVPISSGTSYAPGGLDYGGYAGLAFHDRTLHPAWADDSNATADNPDGTAAPDVYTARVTVVAPCLTDPECDDGDACNGAETCAAASCTPGSPAPDGTVCDDGSRCTTVDRCAAGACAGTAPLVCAACLTCDPARGCAAVVVPGCRRPLTPRAATLAMKDRSGRDLLTWQWAKGAATTAADFGDPLAATTYELCVYDEVASAPRLVLSTLVPAGGVCSGRPCWKRTQKGFRFADRDRSPEGLSRLVLRAGAAGKARIVAKGRGGALRLPALPLALDPRVTVQLGGSDGACWEATYGQALANEPRRFRARSE